MGWLSKLFGSKAKTQEESYKTLKIIAAPQPANGQFRLHGFIESEQGERVEFIRADLYTTQEQASEFTIRKAKQIIDERGGKVFDQGMI
ncbi:MAG: hypothetical protein HWE20_01290 [Gammaproteobacteria bacterium]|nr:hypothetical protein [Gammaproteobacteria bacterium]